MMDYGAHLPLIATDGRLWSLQRLLEYSETAERLGFAALSAGRRLVSAYNTTPESFAAARRRLGEHLRAAGKTPDQFPNAIATMYLHVTADRATAKRIVRDILSPMLGRPETELSQRLLVGPAEECAEKVIAYRNKGAGRLLIWPVEDELRQLAAFWEKVIPLVHEQHTGRRQANLEQGEKP